MQNQLYPVVSLQGSALWSPVTSPVEGWYDYGAGDDAGNDDHDDGADDYEDGDDDGSDDNYDGDGDDDDDDDAWSSAGMV